MNKLYSMKCSNKNSPIETNKCHVKTLLIRTTSATQFSLHSQIAEEKVQARVCKESNVNTNQQPLIGTALKAFSLYAA